MTMTQQNIKESTREHYQVLMQHFWVAQRTTIPKDSKTEGQESVQGGDNNNPLDRLWALQGKKATGEGQSNTNEDG